MMFGLYTFGVLGFRGFLGEARAPLGGRGMTMSLTVRVA